MGIALFLFNAAIERPGETVKVVSGRDISGIYELGTDREIIITAGGGYNLIAISEGAVKMIEANCPSGDCLAQRAIDKTGQQVVCLPNKVLISIDGAKGETAPDSITY
jgi:hypothetical protein